jgi:hypothetical protein
MRKHTWGIVLPQKEIPEFVRNAFPDLQQPRKWIDGTYMLQCITYDPITDAQFALLTLEQLSEHGICSFSCSSEEVQERHHSGKDLLGEPFQITSVSRQDLIDAGFPKAQVLSVDDMAMEQLAREMRDDYCNQLFWNHLPTLAEPIIAESNAEEGAR